MDIYQELQWRGLIAGTTDGLPERLASGAVKTYCGFDPTAASLHVGHLVALMVLARLQRFGNPVIAIAGGGTAMIGDPSGRSAERNLLTRDVIQANLEGIQKQLAGILDFDSKRFPAQIINNDEWLSPMGLMDFLRDVGKHIPVNAMLSKDSVRIRAEREGGVSYTEFSYMLLQAYDFLVLNERHGCELQTGGSDQWGNIVIGIELIRKRAGRRAYGLTHPLVLKADGTKFGKTEEGAVWLSAEATSPFRFYQFWLNTDDRDVVAYLKLFTWLTQPEIMELADQLKRRPEERTAQRTLARQMTAMVHDDSALARAEKATATLFGGAIEALEADELAEVFSAAPTITLPQPFLGGAGVALATLLADTPLASSRTEARHHVEGGGIYLNNRRVTDPARMVTLADAVEGRLLVLRKGRKNFCLVRLME